MKMTKAVFALYFLCTAALLASQSIGTVEYCEGRVSVIRDGKRIARVDMGFSVENLDQVCCEANSTVSLAFLPSSGITGTLTLSEKSSAIIRRDQLQTKTSNDIFLLGGEVSLKVKRLGGADSSIRVRTTTSVLGVRGTEFNAATFYGNSLVACREGEVYCYAYSDITGIQGSALNGMSAVPGRMVAIPESGVIASADFPEGDYFEQWDDLRNRWKSYHVEMISADPVVLLDRLASSWDTALDRVLRDAAQLRKNETASRWLESARRGGDAGTRQAWVTERPQVMKDMLAMRPHLVLATIPWLRIQDLVTLVRKEDMDRTLSDGQTVRAFIRQFDRNSQDFSAAMHLFYALEKQYMLRNDGLSPFMDF